MSIFTILTLIFIVLKLTGHLDWSWVYILMPSIVFVVLWLIFIIIELRMTPEERARKRLGL